MPTDPRLVRVLRAFYVTGAILDGLATLMMLFPALFSLVNAPPLFSAGPEYRFAMGMGASLMAGWTVLLLWASRRPVERAGVLPITIVPVVLGLALNEIRGVASGFVPLWTQLPLLLVQLVLSIVALAAWARARRAGAGALHP